MARIEGHVAARGCGLVRKYLESHPAVFQERSRAASADLIPGTLNVALPCCPTWQSLESEVVPQLGRFDFETDKEAPTHLGPLRWWEIDLENDKIGNTQDIQKAKTFIVRHHGSTAAYLEVMSEYHFKEQGNLVPMDCVALVRE